MRRKGFKPIAIACCFIFLMAAVADLNGKWAGVMKTPDGNELQVIYNFKVAGDTLTGTAESPAGVVTLDSGKVSANTFSFVIIVDGNVYRHTGKFYEDSCGMDIDFGGVIMHTTLTRVMDK